MTYRRHRQGRTWGVRSAGVAAWVAENDDDDDEAKPCTAFSACISLVIGASAHRSRHGLGKSLQKASGIAETRQMRWIKVSLRRFKGCEASCLCASVWIRTCKQASQMRAERTPIRDRIFLLQNAQTDALLVMHVLHVLWDDVVSARKEGWERGVILFGMQILVENKVHHRLRFRTVEIVDWKTGLS